MRRESALFEFWTERNGVKKGEGVVEYSHERPTQQLAIVDPAARGEYVDW